MKGSIPSILHRALQILEIEGSSSLTRAQEAKGSSYSLWSPCEPEQGRANEDLTLVALSLEKSKVSLIYHAQIKIELVPKHKSSVGSPARF